MCIFYIYKSFFVFFLELKLMSPQRECLVKTVQRKSLAFFFFTFQIQMFLSIFLSRKIDCADCVDFSCHGLGQKAS